MPIAIESRITPKPLKYLLGTFTVLYVLLAVVSLLGATVGPIDESLQLLGGREVLNGRMPHRDFWSMYPPSNYYLNAVAFYIGGRTFLMARLVSAVFYVTAVASTWMYYRTYLNGVSNRLWWSSLALTVYVLTRVLTLSQNNAILSSVTLLIYHATEVRAKGRLTRKALVVCGSVSGAILTIRLNFGLYCAASIGAGLIISDSCFRNGSWRTRLERVLAFVTPLSFIVAMFILPYGRHAIDTLAQIALTPNRVLRAGNIFDVSRQAHPYCALASVVGFGLASSRIDWRKTTSVFIACATTAMALCFAATALWELSRLNLLLVPYVVPGLLITVLCFTQIFSGVFAHSVFVALCFLACSVQHYLIRADILHLMILSGGAALVIATSTVSQPAIARLGAWVMLFWLIVLLPLPLSRAGIRPWIEPVNRFALRPALYALLSSDSYFKMGDSARVLGSRPLNEEEQAFFPASDEIAAVRYIERVADTTDSVYAGLIAHDRTTINNTRLSWLMPRPLASRYLELESGIITSEPVQREVVDSLEKGVRWVVLEDTLPIGVARYPFPRSHLLDDYISKNYRCNVSFGAFRVCCRLARCPAPVAQAL